MITTCDACANDSQPSSPYAVPGRDMGLTMQGADPAPKGFLMGKNSGNTWFLESTVQLLWMSVLTHAFTAPSGLLSGSLSALLLYEWRCKYFIKHYLPIFYSFPVKSQKWWQVILIRRYSILTFEKAPPIKTRQVIAYILGFWFNLGLTVFHTLLFHKKYFFLPFLILKYLIIQCSFLNEQFYRKFKILLFFFFLFPL